MKEIVKHTFVNGLQSVCHKNLFCTSLYINL